MCTSTRAVVDGVFEPDAAGGVVFREASGLDEPAIAEMQERVRRRSCAPS
jgi:hypothetical protein